ncbi:TPA: hypothetical protein ACIRVE_005094 [Pseudomonas putida]
MKRRTFAHAEHQAIYDELRKLRPDLAKYRGMGGGGNAYVVGYTQPEQANRLFPKGSRAYAHWAAGVDNALDDRQAAQGDAGQSPAPCA